jgi:hypothetical protein
MVLTPATRRLTMVASERGGEGVRGGVAGTAGNLGNAEVARTQVVSGEGHAPLGEVLHRRLAQSLLECSGEGCPGEATEGSQFGNGPRVGGVGVHAPECWVQARIC